MDIISAAVGFAIGGLLFGGDSRSVTHITNTYDTNIVPILLHFDVKTRTATITCPKCGGLGNTTDRDCSTCRMTDGCSFHTCRACGGSKIQIIIIPKELWQKALNQAKKSTIK